MFQHYNKSIHKNVTQYYIVGCTGTENNCRNYNATCGKITHTMYVLELQNYISTGILKM